MNYSIKLHGLHCEACKKITEKRIGKLNGVTSVVTELTTQTVTVSSDSDLNLQTIEQVLEDTEYKVTAFSEN